MKSLVRYFIVCLLAINIALPSHVYCQDRDQQFRNKKVNKKEPHDYREKDLKNEEEHDEYDSPDKAAAHEIQITKDPATGIVPRERLMIAISRARQSKAQSIIKRSFNLAARSASSTMNWMERGPYSDAVGVDNDNTRPNNGKTAGRIRAAMVDSSDATHRTVWTGGVDGGLWKTTDITASPANWTLVNDYFSTLAVTDICQDPRAGYNNIMYFCTGEAYSNFDAVRGNGVFKSIDNGVTWSQLINTDAYTYCTRILCDYLGNVYLATRGNGLLRSIDGGASWSDITPSGIGNRICDLELSSTSAAGRLHVVSGIFTTQYYRYTDIPAFVTSLSGWTSPVAAFPSYAMRCEIAVSGNVLYALPVDGTYQVPTIYKSINGGANWSAIASQPVTGWASGQGWYALSVGINPADPNQVIIGGLQSYKTTNGGSSWTSISNWYGTTGQYVHADIHDIIWYDAGAKLLWACDGGIHYSSDGGTTIRDRNSGLRIKQFYSVAISPTANSNYMLAGAQDNGVHQLNSGGLTTSIEVTGGDGAIVAIDQNQPQYQFGSYVYSTYRRSINSGANWTYIDFHKGSISSPINFGKFINPFDYDNSANIIYAAADNNEIFRWSTAQTTAAGDYYLDDGFPAGANIVTGILEFNYSLVSAVKVSPYIANRVYFGSSSGRIIRIDNANTAANNTAGINLTGVAMASGNISCINIGTSDKYLMACYSNYGVNNVWISADSGSTWSAMDGNLPDMPVRWGMFYPGDSTKAILATEAGVWETTLLNGSSTVWTANPTFPTVRTDMLQYRSSDTTFAAGTHGRGIFTSKVCTNPPAAPSGTAAIRCGKGTLSLSAIPGAGETIDWYSESIGGSILSSGSNTFTTPTLSVSKIYYAVARNLITGCISDLRTAITATINPNPLAPVGNSASRCSAGSVTISATPGLGETIDWYAAASGGTPLVSSNVSYTTPSISLTTSYYAEARNITTGCKSSSRTTVTAMISTYPSAPVATNGTRCGNGSVTIYATPSSGETIDWYAAASGGTTLLSGNNSYTTPSISLTTSYYAETRNSTSGCKSITRTAVTATVIASPAAPSVSGVSICSGNTATLTASGVGTIRWYNQATGGILLSTGASYTTPPLNSNTSYYVSDSTCAVSNTRTQANVSIIAAPVVIIPTSPDYCLGETRQTIALVDGVPYDGYNIQGQWSSSNTNVASITLSSNGSNVYVTSNSIGTSTISFIATGTDQGPYICPTKVDQAVEVFGLPSVEPITSSNGSIICATDGTGTLQLSCITPYGYWQSSNTLVAQVDANGLVTAYSVGSAIIQYVIIDQVSQCTGVSNFKIRAGLPKIVNQNTSNSVCIGTVLQLTNELPGGIWSSSDAMLATVDQSGLVTGLVAGNVTIYYTFADSVCGTASVNISLNISLPPSITPITSAGNSNNICAANGTGTLQLSNSTLGGNWQSNNEIIATVSASGLVTGKSEGKAIITYSIDNGFGCISKTAFSIIVGPPSEAPQADSVSRCGSGSVTLIATPAEGTTVAWYNSATSTANSALLSIANPFTTVAITTSTTYYVESRYGACRQDLSSIDRTPVTITINPLATAPTDIAITLVSDLCGAKVYRYTAPALITGVDGYQWSFVGTLGSNAIIDSGTLTGRIVRMKYSSNNPASIGDSARVAYTNSLSGCTGDKRSVLLSNISTIVTSPSSIIITSVLDTCGGRIYRYTAPVLVAPATGYEWSFVGALSGNGFTDVSKAVLDSGTLASQVIRVKFMTNTAATIGDSVRLLYTSSCGNTARLAVKLSNTSLSAPSAPASITTTLVSDNCGARIYRYVAPALAGTATGWQWSFVGTLSGNGFSDTSIAVLDSGKLTSQIIRVRFKTNNPAAIGDSSRLAYTSGCGSSPNKAAILTNLTFTGPAAPASITITMVSNVCGARVYRYAAPELITGTTGWQWSFDGNLGTNAQLDSGTLTSQVLKMKFTLNTAAVAGDSARVAYQGCVTGSNKSVILTNTILDPATPTSITITSVRDTCGGRIFRYTAPALVSLATGWEWSFVGALTGNGFTDTSKAVIDSGSLTSQIIKIKYKTNTIAAIGDSVRLRYTSSCINSSRLAVKLTNTALTAPSAPAKASTTITSVRDTCGGRVFRYTAPALTGTATGWLWSFVGTLSGNGFTDTTKAVLDSGTLTSKVIKVKYKTNTAAATGDSARLQFTSGCGNSARLAIKLTNTALVAPAAPASITITSVRDTCGGRVFRYTAPALTGTATGWLWSFVGTLSGNGFTDATKAILDSGSLTSKVIKVKYKTNTAAATGDSARLQFTSGCGNGARLAVKLTNTALVAPAAPVAPTITLVSTVNCKRTYRYSTTSTLTGTATGYLWSFVGTLGSTAQLDSGTLTSRVLRMSFISLAAAGLDSARVLLTSGCGNSPLVKTKLTNTALTCTPVTTIISKNSGNNTDAQLNVSVYPNPSMSEYNVQVQSLDKGEVLIKLVDIQGRLLKVLRTLPYTINFIGGDLRPGIYLLEVYQGKLKIYRKLIRN